MYIRGLIQKTLTLPFSRRCQENPREKKEAPEQNIDWNFDLNLILGTVGIVSTALNPPVGLAFLGAMFLRNGRTK